MTPFETGSSLVRREWGLVLVAVQALTRVPVRAPFEEGGLRRAARYFPLVGILVGIVGAGVFALARVGLPGQVAALLSLGATVLLTGGMHEDGLADCCDGLFGGRRREAALRIMRDSRVGVFGVLGLGVVLGVKVGVVGGMAAPGWALVAGHAAGRWFAMVLPGVLPYARVEGVGMASGVAGPGWVEVVVAGGIGAVAVWPLGWRGVVGVGVAGVVAAGFGWWVRGRIGGYTGDVLGAVQVLTEVSVLLVAAWHGG